jgi:hypothetical protein
MKKAALAALLLGLGIGAFVAYRRSPVDPPNAYTLDLEERAGPLVRKIRIGQRSDGTRVMLETIRGYKPDVVRRQRTIRMSDGRRVRTWESAKLKSTGNDWTPRSFLLQEAIEALPGEECSTPEFRIAGKELVERLTIIRLKQKGSTRELRRALELGCEVVGDGSHSELRLIRWEAGEPDETLYKLDDYQESPHNEAILAELRATGTPEDVVQREAARMSGTRAGSIRRP